MCGILGSINIENVQSLLPLIRHRGPDACGGKVFNINSHSINLQHQRLSIVDLSENGSQPMLTNDEKACIIFNGEIYNHEQLKRKLSEFDFRGHSDTETIINYFKKFGINNTVKDLNGIFAFAYLDISAQKLYLARDRFGVKPLYYYFQNNQLLFSSELKPLKKELKPLINKTALFTGMYLRYVPSPLTVYNNIYKAEPGQLLTFDFSSDNINLSKEYFLETPKHIGSREDAFSKLVNEYGDLFTKAVERQLMSDVEIGILLSGGIDSALVAAIAKDKSSSQIKAFTVGFEEGHDEIDEISQAQQTAEVLGLEHYFTRITFDDFTTSFRKIVQIVEEPIATTSIIPMYFLSQLAASKVKVVLSGQGADEPLGGYTKYKGLPFLEYAKKAKAAAHLLKLLSPFYKSNEHARRLFSAMQEDKLFNSYMEFISIFSIDEINNLTSLDEREVINQGPAFFENLWEKRSPDNASLTNTFLHQDLHASLSDDLLMYTDKITMHFSLECRVPILDNDLIAFIETLDKKYKFNSKERKIIHKAFAKKYLPDSIINRKKLGFKTPTDYWFNKYAQQLKEELIQGYNFNKIFNQEKVAKLIDAHVNGKNLEKQIFLLLSIYYLLDKPESYAGLQLATNE